LIKQGLLALQGPASEHVLARHAPPAAQMRFMDIRELSVAGVACIVSRSGYTGEDGFEIGMANEDADHVARALLDSPDVLPIGLGARDSLRLEAGLCLYGADLTTQTTPVEGALEWSIQKSRRVGGNRAGGFPGDSIIARQMEQGCLRRRIGLRPTGRAPVRGGAALFASLESTVAIGAIISGCFGPTLGAAVAMSYLASAHASLGDVVFAELRGTRVPLKVSATPLVAHAYKR
jgi:aminomethyltransferase